MKRLLLYALNLPFAMLALVVAILMFPILLALGAVLAGGKLAFDGLTKVQKMMER